MAVHHVTKAFLMAVTLLAILPGPRDSVSEAVHDSTADSYGSYGADRYGYRPDYGRTQYGYGGYRGYGNDYRHKRPDSSSDDSDDSSDCVSVEPAKPSSGEAATCEAVERQENQTQALEDRVMGFGGEENALIETLSGRLEALESAVDSIEGVGEEPRLLLLSNGQFTLFICEVFNIVEVAELCRFFGISRMGFNPGGSSLRDDPERFLVKEIFMNFTSEDMP